MVQINDVSRICMMAAVLMIAGCEEKAAPPPPGPATPPAPTARTPVDDQPAMAGQDNASAPGEVVHEPPVSAPPSQGNRPAPPQGPQDTPGSGVNTDPKTATFVGLTAPKPATWIWNPPATQFTVAEYIVPGQEGSGQARISISQAGGTVDANIARWAGQFRSPDHDAVEPIVETFDADGMPVTLVELSGEYRGMTSVFTPDQLFLGAIVQAPSGQTFIKFVGPAATVESNREAFMQMLRALKKIEPEK